MSVSSLRAGVVAAALAAATLLSGGSAHAAELRYTWQPITAPDLADSCSTGAVSPNGANFILACMSLPEERQTLVVRNGQERHLSDAVGGERFEVMMPQRLNDTGWVYGLVAHYLDDAGAGMRLARWTPSGELQLAPTTPETPTHHNLGKTTTAEAFALAKEVNAGGDALVDFRTPGAVQGSSWIWRQDGTATPVMPVNPGRRADATGLADDGTVVFNDREPGGEEFVSHLPYRRLPNGTSVPLSMGESPNVSVHAISPSGKVLAGAALIRGSHNAPWVRWEAPSFAPQATPAMEETPGYANRVTDAGVIFTGESVVRGGVETKLYQAFGSNVPTGTLFATDMTEDGRILAAIGPRDSTKPNLLGWLVPTP